MYKLRAFTLVELLVVISIIALLLGILMPSLQKARKSAKRIMCQSNMRNLELAQFFYAEDNDGKLVDAGLPHGGSSAHEPGAWINTLQDYYQEKLLCKSPVDNSPHWPREMGGKGMPVEGTDDQYRRTSYGINNYLTQFAPLKTYDNIKNIRKPAYTVQFLIMAFEGNFAGSDHTHIENWCPYPPQPDKVPQFASINVQIDAHGGPEKSKQSKSNYGFLDGHAETRQFQEVFTDYEKNSFDPEVVTN